MASPKKPAQKAKPLSKPAKARAAWTTLHSALRTPHSALVILLTLAALLLRLAGLGQRAMSHDESLHTLYSWYLSSSFHYEHDPMMHGPLLFHLNALIYTLFGATDFTSRLAPALMGAACVPVVGLLYKRWLGAAGSLISAALVAISPGLLYYSRYIRNDIYIALFTLILFWAALRYRETASPTYLLWLSGSLALSFACKEVAYIHGTVLGAAAVLFALTGFRASRSLHCADRRWGDVAGTLLTLALPFATALPLTLFGADPTASRDPFLQRIALLTALTLSSVSWGMATLWFTDRTLYSFWMKAFALFWGIQILLYSTLLSNLPQGLTSGIASGLGYWLAQHEVQRGASDPLFYLSLLLLYTPLLLFTLFLRLKHFREPFTLLVLLWTFGNFAIYSIAGERMPWLLIHITLPLCLLAGPAIANAFATRSHLRFVLIPLAAHLVINSLRAVGPLAESPNEPLFYAHAGPHIKTALRILDSHYQHQPDTLIHIDPDYTWPLAWYLREHPAIYSPLPQPEAVIRITAPDREADYIEQGWTPRGHFELIHWPRQHWHALSRSNFRQLATSARVRRNFLRFYFLRELPHRTPGDFPQPVRFALLTRKHP